VTVAYFFGPHVYTKYVIDVVGLFWSKEVEYKVMSELL